MAKSAKFKDLLKEAIGGMVTIKPIGGMMGGSQSRQNQDNFNFNQSALNDIFKSRNKKSRFVEEKSVVLREDDEGSITLKRTGLREMEIVIRRGSKENVYSLSEEAQEALEQLLT